MCTLFIKEISSIEEICVFQSQCCFDFKESHPCHFAHTRHNLCSSLRAMEWFECTMHITCFHLVVTSLVCIHQEWWVFEHQVCVVQQSICESRRQCWLCLKPFITTRDDVACSCEESFMLLESVGDGIFREMPSLFHRLCFMFKKKASNTWHFICF